MHETDADLAYVDDLGDRSFASAGSHLLSIMKPEHRMTARQLSELLTGVQVLALSTVTAAGEPRVAPVDGLFFRGRFWFGSAHDSVRFRHLRKRPQVSAVLLRGEQFAVIVHGRAHEVDVSEPAAADFRAYCLEVYGDSWLEWGAPAAYARLDADRMYTYRTG